VSAAPSATNTLYRGLASGAMNVVAPLSAVLTAVLPAIVELAGGDRLGLAGWAGLVLAVPTIRLVPLSPNPDSNHPAQARGTSPVQYGVGCGLLAGCGFGLLFVGLDKADTTSGAWPLLSDQIVAVLLVVTATTYLRRHSPSMTRQSTPWSGALVWGLASGLGGAGGNIFFFAATAAGSLTIVAGLSALYRATTIPPRRHHAPRENGPNSTHRADHLCHWHRTHHEHVIQLATA
jgi:uncharacterized membrane protein